MYEVSTTSATVARKLAIDSRKVPVNTPRIVSIAEVSSICSQTIGKRKRLVNVATVRARFRATFARETKLGDRVSKLFRCLATAVGDMSTRAPLKCARQQKSRSSPKNEISGLNPFNSRNKSERTSMHAELTKNTSRTASCCSWSLSFCSMNGSISPQRSIPKPTDCKSVGFSHCKSFGPTTAAFEMKSSSTNVRKVFACKTTSSCMMQKRPLSPSTIRCSSLIKRPKPGLPSTILTTALGRLSFIDLATALAWVVSAPESVILVVTKKTLLRFG